MLSQDRMRNYLHSAITATFVFVLLRETGWLRHAQYSTQVDTQARISGALNQNSDSTTKTPQKLLGTGGLRVPAAPAANSGVAQETKRTTRESSDSHTAGKAQSDYVSMPTTSPSSRFTSPFSSAATTTTASTPSTFSRRPRIYTFFQHIAPQHKGTQMSDQADNDLIMAWRSAWTAAGWEPRVLSLQDAQRHPKFAEYKQQLEKIPMLGVDGKGGNVVYNQLCFLRWLAMASVGGGFMSDYDVFPLTQATPSAEPLHNSDFTVYSVVKGSKTAGIPCLMSGRADEWTRMAFAILQNGLEHAAQSETKMWSDMFALIDMRKDGVYHAIDGVVEGQDVLVDHEWTERDCVLTNDKLAVHFSHEAIVQGHAAADETPEHRPQVARRFLARWYEVCVMANNKRQQQRP